MRIRALGSPPAPPPAALPTTPILHSASKMEEPSTVTKVPTTPGRAAPRSPVIVPGTTAQDLLNNVMATKRGPVDVSRQQRSPTSSSIQPQFPFGLGPNAPPSIWSMSLDHPSSPHLQSSPSLSATSPGHRQAMSLSSGTPQQVPQLPFQTSYTLSGPMTQYAERWQSQWQNPKFIDPAIVSSASPSQPTPHYGGLTPYQGFSNGHTQQYIPPGQHQKSSSTSRAWGVHG